MKGLKKKLERDEKFKNSYVEFMTTLFKKNYAKPCPEERKKSLIEMKAGYGIFHIILGIIWVSSYKAREDTC